MLDGDTLRTIFEPLRRVRKTIALRELDLSNNRLNFTREES